MGRSPAPLGPTDRCRRLLDGPPARGRPREEGGTAAPPGRPDRAGPVLPRVEGTPQAPAEPIEEGFVADLRAALDLAPRARQDRVRGPFLPDGPPPLSRAPHRRRPAMIGHRTMGKSARNTSAARRSSTSASPPRTRSAATARAAPPVRPGGPGGGAWAGRPAVQTIDEDQGRSGARSDHRDGFKRLLAEIGAGQVGLVLALEASRLARSSVDWHRLVEICGITKTLLADESAVYDPRDPNDRLLLGVKGTLSEAELMTHPMPAARRAVEQGPPRRAGQAAAGRVRPDRGRRRGQAPGPPGPGPARVRLRAVRRTAGGPPGGRAAAAGEAADPGPGLGRPGARRGPVEGADVRRRS